MSALKSVFEIIVTKKGKKKKKKFVVLSWSKGKKLKEFYENIFGMLRLFFPPFFPFRLHPHLAPTSFSPLSNPFKF